jgi:hypothetical protein
VNRGSNLSIRLFPKNVVRPNQSTESRHGLYSNCEFQISTLWHKPINMIECEDTSYLAKTQIAQDAISSGQFEGGWMTELDGGHFMLKHVVPKVETLRCDEMLVEMSIESDWYGDLETPQVTRRLVVSRDPE